MRKKHLHRRLDKIDVDGCSSFVPYSALKSTKLRGLVSQIKKICFLILFRDADIIVDQGVGVIHPMADFDLIVNFLFRLFRRRAYDSAASLPFQIVELNGGRSWWLDGFDLLRDDVDRRRWQIRASD